MWSKKFLKRLPSQVPVGFIKLMDKGSQANYDCHILGIPKFNEKASSGMTKKEETKKSVICILEINMVYNLVAMWDCVLLSPHAYYVT